MQDRASNRLKSWFSSYVSSFYTGHEEFDRVIQLKETHTVRVSIGMRRLGRALNLAPRDLRLAEIIGLLHDIGRFEQYARYRTFRDRMSENHGKLGLRVIGRHGLLSGFDSGERRHIARAVAFHNALCLPALTDATSLFFLKLIRDADKLDIWRVAIGHFEGRSRTPKAVNEFRLSGDGCCSPAVLAAIRAGRVVPIDAVRSASDAKLLYVSWVFDMNFRPSFRETLRGRYLDRLAVTMPDSAEVRSAIQIAGRHAARNASQGGSE